VGEVQLYGVRSLAGLAPLLQRGVEAIKLRLEIGQA
jgi:hypothetical protein